MLRGASGRRARLRAVIIGMWVAAGGFVALGLTHRALAVTPALPATGKQQLEVLPFPNTPDASPATQIDFPALSPSELRGVIVRGSRTGLHRGRLSAQPDGRGTAFTPLRRFSAGERVSVTAALRSRAAGTASGAPGATQLRFSFTVARPVAQGIDPARTRVSSGPDTSGRATPAQTATTRSYVSAPTLHPPIIHTSGRVGDPRSGDVFLDAEQTSDQAPFIVNPKGQLVWMPSSTSYPAVFDLRVQRYAVQSGKPAKPVLTFWEGTLKGAGDGDGVGVILNQEYQQVATIKAGNGYASDGVDGHELTLTHSGTAFVTVYAPAKANLTSVGGPVDGTVLDTLIQEIDVHTGHVVWEWHPLGHVPIRDSYAGTPIPGQPYDAYHLNSIQQLPGGNLIVSMRNSWAVYEINKKTGRIMWELGGKHSSFKMGHGTNFEWQHDAQLEPGGLVTLFDDAALPVEEKQSRALEIHLNQHRKLATLRRAFRHDPSVLAGSEGSAQLLPNHHLFVGWGLDARAMAAAYSEYSSSGHQEFTASFVWPVTSYRAYRFPWTGKPTSPPSIAVSSTSKPSVYDVYASWDGATHVAKWQVLGSTSQTGTFNAVGSPARRSGFETKVPATTGDTWFEVKALNASGHLLPHGTSAPVRAQAP